MKRIEKEIGKDCEERRREKNRSKDRRGEGLDKGRSGATYLSLILLEVFWSKIPSTVMKFKES